MDLGDMSYGLVTKYNNSVVDIRPPESFDHQHKANIGRQGSIKGHLNVVR